MQTPPSGSITPGSVLAGKYRLLRPIGRGGMGWVWAAMNQTTSREVAVKLLLLSSPDLQRRLMREARACGALKHPNVIDIYDVAETDSGEPFLVMELLTGETLAQVLAERRRLDSPEAARVALEAARALDAAHALGIVHRDLKPANIFMHAPPGAAGPIVKVLDFGVAKRVGGDDGLRTVAGGLIGSPAYMSPEQARADRTIDHRSDLWSLGVVLFQMLTGVRPFTGEAPEILEKIAAGPIPTVAERIRNADPRLNEIVARCLERDRDERIGAASEIVRILESVVRSPCPSQPEAIAHDDPAGPGPDAAVFVGPPSSRAPAIVEAWDPPPQMDEPDAATLRMDFRRVAHCVRLAAPPAVLVYPEVTPRGTIKISPIKLAQLRDLSSVVGLRAVDSTAAPLVPRTNDAPPASAAPPRAADAPTPPSPTWRFAQGVLAVAAITTGLGLLLLTIVYLLITSGHAPAVAAASPTPPSMTATTPPAPAVVPPSSKATPEVVPASPPPPSPAVPGAAPPTAVEPPSKPVGPPRPAPAAPPIRRPRDCSKLKFLARERCLQGEPF